MDIPVYLIAGFLDSGKTGFINGILRDGFAEEDRTLLICCEEGELEYDPRVLGNVFTYTVEDQAELTPELLSARGISFLMMDFDNTIVPYTTDVPTEPMRAWLEQMKSSNIRLCVVSNSKRPRVVTFCKAYGMDCITHARKPFQKGISECLTRFHLRPSQAALVGDQIYTDVLGANCAGLTSILVSAIDNHTIWLKLRHIAELPFIAIGRRKIQHEKH